MQLQIQQFRIYAPILMACALLCILNISPSYAALTNLAVPNHDFEDLSAQPIPYSNTAFQSAVNTSTAQWSTFGNGYEILAQGADSAPTNNSLGSPTGQSLEILGNFDTGQISFIIDIPSNVIAGSTAQISFQAWSLDDGTGDYYNSGRLRIDDGPGQQPWVNNGVATTISTTQSAWTLNTRSFQVDPGDTIYIQWRDNVTRSANFGLRIDDVQVLVDVIPEPGNIATLILGGLMLFVYWRRRFSPMQALHYHCI